MLGGSREQPEARTAGCETGRRAGDVREKMALGSCGVQTRRLSGSCVIFLIRSREVTDPPCSPAQSAAVWAIAEVTRQEQLWGGAGDH